MGLVKVVTSVAVGVGGMVEWVARAEEGFLEASTVEEDMEIGSGVVVVLVRVGVGVVPCGGRGLASRVMGCKLHALALMMLNGRCLREAL